MRGQTTNEDDLDEIDDAVAYMAPDLLEDRSDW